MKKIINSFPIIILFFVLLTGCKKTETTPSTATTTADPTNVVTSGTWSISSYRQKTEDKTNLFTGITFTFSSDGKLNASGNNSAAGSWSYTAPSATYYGSNTGSFSISLGANTPFIKLSKAWNVASESSTSLSLDNKEPLEDEHVTFTKK